MHCYPNVCRTISSNIWLICFNGFFNQKFLLQTFYLACLACLKYHFVLTNQIVNNEQRTTNDEHTISLLLENSSIHVLHHSNRLKMFAHHNILLSAHTQWCVRKSKMMQSANIIVMIEKCVNALNIKVNEYIEYAYNMRSYSGKMCKRFRWNKLPSSIEQFWKVKQCIYCMSLSISIRNTHIYYALKLISMSNQQ